MAEENAPLDLSQRPNFLLFCQLSEGSLLPLLLEAGRLDLPMAQVANEIRNALTHLIWASLAKNEDDCDKDLAGAHGHIVRATLDVVKIFYELLPQRQPLNIDGDGYARILGRYRTLVDGSHHGNQEQRLQQGFRLLTDLGLPPQRATASHVVGEPAAIAFILDQVGRMNAAYAEFSVEVGRLHRQALFGYVAAWRCLVGVALLDNPAAVVPDDNAVFNGSGDIEEIVKDVERSLKATGVFYRSAMLDHLLGADSGLSAEHSEQIFPEGPGHDRAEEWSRAIANCPALILRHRAEVGFRVRFRETNGDLARIPSSFSGACWFVDLAGSSGLVKSPELSAVMDAYYLAFRTAIAKPNVHLHLATANTWGDGVFAVFTDVSAALASLQTMVQARAAEGPLRLHRVGLRAGLAIGRFQRQPNPFLAFDVTGPTVVRAARLEGSRPTTTESETTLIVISPGDYARHATDIDQFAEVGDMTMAAGKAFVLDDHCVEAKTSYAVKRLAFRAASAAIPLPVSDAHG